MPSFNNHPMVITKRERSWASTVEAILSSVESGWFFNSAIRAGSSSSSIKVIGKTSPILSLIRSSVSGQFLTVIETRPLRDMVSVGKPLNMTNGLGREG